MSLTRRGFLASLLTAPCLRPLANWWPAALAPRRRPGPTLDEIYRVTAQQLQPAVTDACFKTNPLLAYLRDRSGTVPRPPEQDRPIQPWMIWDDPA